RTEACSWLDEAKRQLRNISVFLLDSLENAPNAEKTQPLPKMKVLVKLAAGSTFGGIGTAGSKIRGYRKWLKKQAKANLNSSRTSPQAMPDFVRSLIDELERLESEVLSQPTSIAP
ncbi:unnamed protein product, partial [Hapterophycus canaliculatus]